jgi:hypothetical protein
VEPLWNGFPGMPCLLRVPIGVRTTGLQQYSVGVGPESSHVRADLVRGGDGLGTGAVRLGYEPSALSSRRSAEANSGPSLSGISWYASRIRMIQTSLGMGRNWGTRTSQSLAEPS